MRFVAIMDPTHQWPVFDAAAIDTPSHAGAKHGEVALRQKCLWRPPAELLVELQTRPRCSIRLRQHRFRAETIVCANRKLRSEVQGAHSEPRA